MYKYLTPPTTITPPARDRPPACNRPPAHAYPPHPIVTPINPAEHYSLRKDKEEDRSSTHSVHPCEAVSGNETCIGVEETLKERNRRLLAKERERLSQREAKILKQKGKNENCDEISQAIEVKNIAVAKNLCNEGAIARVEHMSKRREISSVDRRWEIELVSRMRDKIQTKAEKSRKPTVKRVVWWGNTHIPKLVTHVIKIYSSSASRFAAFKSNLSHKPGD